MANRTSALVELMRPNKTDVLSYLDHQGPAPSRYAHVVLDNRATTDPHYADLLVGPLAITNQSTPSWTPLEYPYTRKTHGRVRNLDADYSTIYSEWLYKISASIADITLDLFNGTALGLDNDTLDIWGIDPSGRMTAGSSAGTHSRTCQRMSSTPAASYRWDYSSNPT